MRSDQSQIESGKRARLDAAVTESFVMDLRPKILVIVRRRLRAVSREFCRAVAWACDRSRRRVALQRRSAQAGRESLGNSQYNDVVSSSRNSAWPARRLMDHIFLFSLSPGRRRYHGQRDARIRFPAPGSAGVFAAGVMTLVELASIAARCAASPLICVEQ